VFEHLRHLQEQTAFLSQHHLVLVFLQQLVHQKLIDLHRRQCHPERVRQQCLQEWIIFLSQQQQQQQHHLHFLFILPLLHLFLEILLKIFNFNNIYNILHNLQNFNYS
jgi:hypothetical protein